MVGGLVFVVVGLVFVVVGLVFVVVGLAASLKTPTAQGFSAFLGAANIRYYISIRDARPALTRAGFLIDYNREPADPTNKGKDPTAGAILLRGRNGGKHGQQT